MTNLFVRRLAGFGYLSRDDELSLLSVCQTSRVFAPDQLMVAEGDIPAFVFAILEGFACRFKSLPRGERQIVDFLVPGDLCNGHTLFAAPMDHSVGTLTTCRVAFIADARLRELQDTHPRLVRALWWGSMIQESVAREWIVNVGARPGSQRLAHLFCELCHRLRAVGLEDKGQFRLPLTQTDLAEATGLTVVHVSRMLKVLRSAGLLVFSRGLVQIDDVARLEEYCGFDAGYLHMQPQSGRLLTA